MGFDTLRDWLSGLDFGLMIVLDSCQFNMTYLLLQGSMTKHVCSSHSEGSSCESGEVTPVSFAKISYCSQL